MTEIIVRPTSEAGIGWVDATGMPAGSIAQTDINHLARELALWVDSTRNRNRRARRLSMFERQSYVAPDNPYAQMSAARMAVDNDDIVGGVADTTEGLAFQGVKWESAEADDADIFNQINIGLNLDRFVRSWYRELFTYSQAVVGVWWGQRTFTVRGSSIVLPLSQVKVDPATGRRPKPKKVKRKKQYNVLCPLALTLLDPMKVVPLRPGPFGQDRLCWNTTRAEYVLWESGEFAVDPVMSKFIVGKPQLGPMDMMWIAEIGLDPNRLLELDPNFVFRTTRTKADYQPFPANRLRSVFPQLDLKQQLIEADRVSLVGAANYLLLVKKGDKDNPAKQAEIDNLKENMQVLAKLPVIVGDHRLNIEIITPSQDSVLDTDRYDTIDKRIMNRTLGSLTVTSRGQRNESTLTVARGVSRWLESQRLIIKRALEEHVARKMLVVNPDTFAAEPNLAFTPRHVQLDADVPVVNAIMALRSQKELSRESTLEWFGFDQEVEAQRREHEEDSGLDDIFGTTIPFSSPMNQEKPDTPNGAPEPPQVSGARGGRPVGGGDSPQSPQGQIKPRTGRGNVSTKGGQGQ